MEIGNLAVEAHLRIGLVAVGPLRGRKEGEWAVVMVHRDPLDRASAAETAEVLR